MSRTRFFRRGLASLTVLAGLLTSPTLGQNCDCCKGPCPPFMKYRFEGPPRICFKHGCPKPICDPCHLPHYGYYPVCWQPWPFEQDWSHCPVPPPGALVQPIPPKRFREPPRIDDKSREETGPNPMRTGGAYRQPQWQQQQQQMPQPSDSIVPRPLPPHAIQQTVSQSVPLNPPQNLNDPRNGNTPKPLPSSLSPFSPTNATTPPTTMPGTPVVPEVRRPETTTPVAPPVTPTNYRPSEGDAQRPQSINSGAGTPPMRMVNSRRILLDYDLAEVPKPEQAMLELWYTQDSKNWIKDELSVTTGSPYIVEVNKEGTYGFMMIARAPGEKSTPPAPGETPQVWVEVDWTRPAVQMIDVRAGMGPTGKVMSLMWTATDNNMSRSPVTLSYAETPEGPWRPYATGIENTGRHDWQLPANLPQRIYLKVEATDLVGNVGVAVTPVPVQLP